MLEISLSAVAAFAAFTAYTIISDEIRSNARSQKTTGNQKAATAPKPAANKPSAVKAKPEQKPKPLTTRRTRAKVADSSPADPISATSTAILAYLSSKGAVTITNLSKELQTDKDIVAKAAEKLIAEKAAVAAKRGGYPAIAPLTN